MCMCHVHAFVIYTDEYHGPKIYVHRDEYQRWGDYKFSRHEYYDEDSCGGTVWTVIILMLEVEAAGFVDGNLICHRQGQSGLLSCHLRHIEE